jgi:hypothetical protein
VSEDTKIPTVLIVAMLAVVVMLFLIGSMGPDPVRVFR